MATNCSGSKGTRRRTRPTRRLHVERSYIPSSRYNILTGAAVLILCIQQLYQAVTLRTNITVDGGKNGSALPPLVASIQYEVLQTFVDTGNFDGNSTDSRAPGVSVNVILGTVNVSDPTIYLPRYLTIVQTQSYSWLEMEEPTQPLAFLHIPKTGGSSIENDATAAGLSWGLCMFWNGAIHVACLPTGQPSKTDKGPARISPWHTPIQYLAVKHSGSANANTTVTNPYANHDLFAVIRNPYARAVSEYYFQCSIIHCFWHEEDTPRILNREIQKALKIVKNAGNPSPGKMPPKEYFLNDGHWIPQSDYFFFPATYGGRQRLVQHMLHFENLSMEFASLMNAYHLEVNLTKHVTLREGPKPKCTAADLTSETREMIEDLYEEDFRLGGYVMIEKESKEIIL